ncbi:MAG: hypothetical protein ACKVH5_10150 [Fidelibacterota bacterium]|jgi:hypothetical protein
MSPIIKTLIVVFGGMAVMVVTTVCGAVIALDFPLEHGNLMVYNFYGAVIGAVVGGLLWGLLGYMVLRVKKPTKLLPGPPSS